MNLRRWLLPAASLVAVAAFTMWEFSSSRTGPGQLHPAHHELEGFFLGADCSSCHREGEGINAEGCIRCHEPIGQQRASKKGLHGNLPSAQLDDCSQCHSEHMGERTPLITAQAFLFAGVKQRDAYDHRHVPGYSLGGAHAALACARCHASADAAQPPKGGRFLGLQQQCVACHEDVHLSSFGSDCEKCHGQVQPFKAAPGFDHAVFPLIGAHSRVGCAKCHEEGTPHATAALAKDKLPTRKCAECHEDPHHDRPGIPAKAMLLDDTADCSRCHASTKWSDARVTPAKHAEFGFPLRGGHAKAECKKCHGDGQHASKHPGELPPLDACARCHDSPHQKPFLNITVTAGKGSKEGCAECHVDEHTSFRGAEVTAQQHSATGFALALPHDKVECSKCHTGDTFAARYPGRVQKDCRACHADTHKGQFDHEQRYSQCTACHATTAFHPTAFDAAMHAKTKFPLTGAHDAVACARCHDDVKEDVRAFHGTTQKCGDCHEDVHKGAFDVAGKPAEVRGKTGCARCHDTAAFQPIRAENFDHALWTGYRLDGAHAKADCAKCHPQTTDAGHKRLGKAIGKRCADCHQDKHQGQFSDGKGTDCARCHETVDFKKPKFDHDRDSRFRLDAQHALLDCSKCHHSYETPFGPLVRYKPLGVECGDCHKLGAVVRRKG